VIDEIDLVEGRRPFGPGKAEALEISPREIPIVLTTQLGFHSDDHEVGEVLAGFASTDALPVRHDDILGRKVRVVAGVGVTVEHRPLPRVWRSQVVRKGGH
jgi:hypothetical protein